MSSLLPLLVALMVVRAVDCVTAVAQEFHAVDGGRGRVCRGASADDYDASHYRLHANVNTLEACKRRCKEAALCTAISFTDAIDRCEVWTRVVKASVEAATISTCLRYGGPMPLRSQRFWVNASTGAKAMRPGFRYPRWDSRLHDGDEVKLKGLKGRAWVSLVPIPVGKFTLRGARVHHYCGLQKSMLVCNRTVAGAADGMSFQDVGQNGRFALQAGGSFCRDLSSGIRCDQDKFPGEPGLFALLHAGTGKIAIQGSRANRICSDQDRGIVCDARKPALLGTFEIDHSEAPRFALGFSKRASAAATFIVRRPVRDSVEVSLLCKDVAKFVSVDARDSTVGCFSDTETKLHYQRLNGSRWWNAARGSFVDASTGKFFRQESTSAGHRVRAVGSVPGGPQLFVVHLDGGYETVLPLIRGVNLGNWLLLEKWMDHKLFLDEFGQKYEGECDAIDEYGIMRLLDPLYRRRRMETHWSTWITEADIQWLATHGINTVRVPFGYWLTHPEPPFVEGQFKYIEKLFAWCERYSLAVLLDFHGLKGCQQGQETCGNCGGCTHKKCGETWVRFLDFEDVNIAVLSNLSRHFARSPVLLGFGVANEVGGHKALSTMAFYQRAYDTIRKHSPDTMLLIYPTFGPEKFPFKREFNMAQDNHLYWRAIGGAGWDHPKNVVRARQWLLSASTRWQVVMGEWSLGGYGTYIKRLNKTALHNWYHDFGIAQIQAYEQHSMGWIYWSYKTIYPGAPWNYREMCERGRLPGCIKGFGYRTADWWSNHPCEFAYLDNTFMGQPCGSKAAKETFV